ncbi:MAG TPA: hypothetical protein VK524_12605 [Polyangiaceae bacterium]|nr:hypothetical protein [Polyangiaceae bacterium]
MSKSGAASSNLDPALADATADTALAAVSQVSTEPDGLIAEWLKRSNAAAIHEVAERGSGKARKAARRALNVLRARGVRVPERKRVASLGAPTEETHEAWLLAPDALGNVMLVFTAHTPASRYRAAFVVLHEQSGIQRVELAELSQSQLKDSMAKAAPGGDYKPVRVPVAWARSRAAQARKRHQEFGIPEPLGLTSAASLLQPVPESDVTHPFDEEGFELSDDDARELCKQSGRLHLLPEFRSWFPARSAVDELLGHVGESLTPGEEPDPAHLNQRMDEEISAATDRYFSPERREQLVRSLKDSGLSVLQRDGEAAALEVAAVMKLVAQAGLITDPPREIPFLRAFFEKAVSVLASQGQGRLRIPVRGQPEGAASGEPEGESAPEPAAQPPSEAGT